MHNAPDCYLGDFSNTNPVTGLTGTFTIYINYGNFYAAMLMLQKKPQQNHEICFSEYCAQ
jgi:hypothetical protein